jgi:hypothetical protein
MKKQTEKVMIEVLEVCLKYIGKCKTTDVALSAAGITLLQCGEAIIKKAKEESRGKKCH